ncbi:hypothetical protein JYU34_018573 [Plutella xylostella]|uniref:Uncharacterized protein n=1 Tax=Plutella xylostella TaxID=51655 RepID=A0ABQ7PY53_PLUXY|nr:hypothetical protein JYU34_018573 [Plutella xylostella]
MAFKGKVVLITGAGSGIGAAAAKAFSRLSAGLALVDKDENGLKKTLEQCEKADQDHLIIVADLSKSSEVMSVVPWTVAHFGRIDVLVNCAGIMSEEKMTDDDVSANFDAVIGINLRTPVILTNKATPYLIETRGSIVNISSMRSTRPCDKRSMYCVSKAGLEMFTKCVALDLADRGVRANSIHPGVVRTNIQFSYNPEATPDAHYAASSKKFPFGVTEPEEVAQLVVFLASSETARTITGAAYYIDGGQSLMETRSLAGKF